MPRFQINHHIKGIYEDAELSPEATIRQYRIVQTEGARLVGRLVEHYNLDVILAVGYRVRSPRGVQFRQRATERLREYLVKGASFSSIGSDGGKYFVENEKLI